MQVPATHAGVGAMHLLAHAPQLALSVISLTQALPQRLPVLHAGVHVPEMHDVLPPVPVGTVHLLLHDPQLFLSLLVLVSHPLARLLSQLA